MSFSLHGLHIASTGLPILYTRIARYDLELEKWEKVEGLAVTWSGDLWVALDNDGGEFESRLVRYRDLLRLSR